MRFGTAVGAAITRPRELLHQDGKIMSLAAAVLLVLAAVGAVWPKAIAWPSAAIAVWFALAFLIRAWRGRRDARRTRKA